MIKYTRLRLMGYPKLREVLRTEFRQHRSTKRVCDCGRLLIHSECSWIAIRGEIKVDYMVCHGCEKEFVGDLLTLQTSDVVWLIAISGDELFI